MSQLGGLARFTPSVLDKDTLEALFVHRESLVEDAVDRVRRASTTKERANRLFVGPRGAGKTHLVSLIAHRSRAIPGFGETVQLAWLPEDLWAIGDFDDLRKEILKAIEPPEPLADASTMDGGLRELAGRVAERGPVVVIIENLDQVLRDLGPDGQRKLRAAIESDRSMLLIATATRLTADLLDQDSPFYGFFDTFDLQQFDVDEAADMLKAIARQRGDEALVEELDKPQARARLAAVAHLAGGQPRIWALFGAGLTVEGLDDLVSVLLERFDDLTPYYQEQLRRLSVNERKAVQALAEADRALPVKALAELTGISERSLSKTMGDLRKADWVKVKTGPLMDLVDKRLTYHELAEPLARLAFQLKASHGEPVKLVVDFLKTWYLLGQLGSVEAPGQLGTYLDAARRDQTLTSDSNLLAVVTLGTGELPPISPAVGRLLAGLDDALFEFANGDPAPLLSLPSSVTDTIGHALDTTSLDAVRFKVNAASLAAADAGRWPERAERLASSVQPPAASCVLVLDAMWSLRAGALEEATGYLERSRGEWQSSGAPFLAGDAVQIVSRLAVDVAAGAGDPAVLSVYETWLRRVVLDHAEVSAEESRRVAFFGSVALIAVAASRAQATGRSDDRLRESLTAVTALLQLREPSVDRWALSLLYVLLLGISPTSNVARIVLDARALSEQGQDDDAVALLGENVGVLLRESSTSVGSELARVLEAWGTRQTPRGQPGG